MIDCAIANQSEKLVRKSTNRQITVHGVNKSLRLDTIAQEPPPKKKRITRTKLEEKTQLQA